jgi:hypothetical protein
MLVTNDKLAHRMTIQLMARPSLAYGVKPPPSRGRESANEENIIE